MNKKLRYIAMTFVSIILVCCYMVLRVEVGDKGSHQASLADAGCQSKSQGHKVTLKIGADRIHSVDSAQCRFQIHTFTELYGVGDLFKNLQRLRLRLAERHDAADIVCGIERKIVGHPLPPRRNHHIKSPEASEISISAL